MMNEGKDGTVPEINNDEKTPLSLSTTSSVDAPMGHSIKDHANGNNSIIANDLNPEIITRRETEAPSQMNGIVFMRDNNKVMQISMINNDRKNNDNKSILNSDSNDMNGTHRFNIQQLKAKRDLYKKMHEQLKKHHKTIEMSVFIFNELLNDVCLDLCVQVMKQHRRMKHEMQKLNATFNINGNNSNEMKAFAISVGDESKKKHSTELSQNNIQNWASGTEIYSRTLADVQNNISHVQCDHCNQFIASSRYAPHLDRCITRSLRATRSTSSTRGTSSKKKSKKYETDLFTDELLDPNFVDQEEDEDNEQDHTYQEMGEDKELFKYSSSSSSSSSTSKGTTIRISKKKNVNSETETGELKDKAVNSKKSKPAMGARMPKTSSSYTVKKATKKNEGSRQSANTSPTKTKRRRIHNNSEAKSRQQRISNEMQQQSDEGSIYEEAATPNSLSTTSENDATDSITTAADNMKGIYRNNENKSYARKQKLSPTDNLFDDLFSRSEGIDLDFDENDSMDIFSMDNDESFVHPFPSDEDPLFSDTNSNRKEHNIAPFSDW
jgi:hypothetical protein